MTRLGLHVNTTRRFTETVDWYRRLQPPWMLTLTPDRDLCTEIKRVSPQTKIIGRVVEDGLTFDNYSAFQARILTAARDHPWIDAWVGWNEPAFEGDDMRRLAGLETGLASRLMDLGKIAVIGGFSTGFLEEEDHGGRRRCWEHWAKAFEFITRNPGRVYQHSHYYAGPYIGLGVETRDGRNQFPASGFTGATTDAKRIWDEWLTGWLLLRNRKIAPKIAAAGFKVPLLITECGVDNTPPRPGGPGNGFRNFLGTEWTQTAWGDYANQLYWAGWQWSWDSPKRWPGLWVAGAMVYCIGSENEKWLPFDLGEEQAIRARAVNLQTQLPLGYFDGSGPVPPTPAPEPIPVPTPTTGVQPRIMVVTGDGWTALARRALMREPKVAEVAAMRAANNSQPLKPGAWVLSPFHKVVTR